MPENSISQQQIDDAHLQHFAGLGAVLPANRTTNSIAAPPDEDQSAPPVAVEPTQSAKDVVEVTDFTTKNTRPLWASPWLKLLLAGSGIFLILVVVGLGLNNSMSGVTTRPQTPTTTHLGDATPAPTADEKDGLLNTKVALTTQAQELQNLNQQAAKPKPLVKVKPVTKEPSPLGTAPVARFAPQPVSAPVVAPPPPRFVPRTTWQAVKTVPQQKSVTQPSAPAPVLSPMEQWNAAANIGSYGTVLPTSNPPTTDSDSKFTDTATQTSEYQTASTTTGNSDWQASGGLRDIPQQASTTTENSDWQPSGRGTRDLYKLAEPLSQRLSDTTSQSPKKGSAGLDRFVPGDGTRNGQAQPQLQTSQPQTPQIENNYQRASYSSDLSTPRETPVLSRKVGTLVSVGTRTSGKLDTPIRWSGDSSQNSGLPDLLIELTKPLKTVEGFEAIPAGSYLTVQVISADSAGILQLSPISVQLRDGQEKPLPEGAILIFDKKGNMLQAKFHAPGTRKNFLSELGDAAGIAGLATDDSSLYVLNALRDRQDSQPRPSYFSLDKGTSVEIYVKQSFSL